MTTQPLPPKRNLFKKPAWASTSASAPTTTSDDIFTRKTSALSSLVKENEERRRRKVEQAAEKTRKEKRRSEEKREEDKSEQGSAKKRRISEEDYKRHGLVSPAKRAQEAAERGEREETGAREGRGKGEKEGRRRMSIEEELEEELREEKMEVRTSPRRSKTTQKVITLSDEDEHEELYARSPKRAVKKKPAPLDDSDEEFPELAALARERRKKREQEASGTPASVGTITPKLEEFDPVIKVLVTSPIKDTKPLLVHRKLSQRLQEIRTVWCQKQGFDEEMTIKVFLIYKMRKLYDVTTCKSLGIKVDSQGALIGSAGGDDDEGRVHVEAVTEEVFEQMKKRRNEARRPLIEGETPEEESKEENAGATVKIRLVLKAKGYKDYKLIVRPTTTFERIASAFKREHEIADDVDVAVVQDGDPLPMNDQVQDAEVEDLDCLEIHIK
ncbi:Hypothetical protein D9617_2g052310 [Elsinoe fawcettii]|nr:Hypothetical protein D9617_2g052310 [Elsinoe fawcettii]